MKTKNIKHILNILNERLDSDRLFGLNIQVEQYKGDCYTPENILNIFGEPEAITECVLNIYGTIYEEEPELLTKYTITTSPANNSTILLQITDLEK